VRIILASWEDPRRLHLTLRVRNLRNHKSQLGLLPQSKKRNKKMLKLMILLSLLMILTMKSIWKITK
jgi:hypothetical protein